MAYPSPPAPLETVDFTLKLPTRRNEHTTTLFVAGRSQDRRTALWTYEEVWSWSEQQDGLQPVDVLHHIGLCTTQNRPNSRFMLDRSMQGLPCWEQGELPLGM